MFLMPYEVFKTIRARTPCAKCLLFDLQYLGRLSLYRGHLSHCHGCRSGTRPALFLGMRADVLSTRARRCPSSRNLAGLGPIVADIGRSPAKHRSSSEQRVAPPHLPHKTRPRSGNCCLESTQPLSTQIVPGLVTFNEIGLDSTKLGRSWPNSFRNSAILVRNTF